MDIALSLVLRLLIDKDHFLSCFGSSTTSFPDQSRVAPSSRERGIGCGTLASNDAIKSSPVLVRSIDGNAISTAGGTGTLFGEDEVEKNECGEVSVRMGPGALGRASLRAFIFSAR